MRLRFRQLQAFHAIIDTGTVTGAAALLGISQPGISNLIAQLERETRLDLFSRTKGLSARLTLSRHVMRNAALPVVTYVGVQLAYLIEGVVIVETVFAWPGIGHALVHAIFGRDIAMVQGTALVLGLTYVALNLFVDLACRGIDPRGGTT